MPNLLTARWRQGHRTLSFPDGPPPAVSERFRGRPSLGPGDCPATCRRCADVCPTGAANADGGPKIDLGRCLFCAECVEACAGGPLRFTGEHRLASSTREGLVLGPRQGAPEVAPLRDIRGRLFRRSLKLRQVSAGGCNACEADLNVLNTVGWDLGRFGIQFVASPRHADGLVVTGPVTQNMVAALEKTYEAVPEPKLVIASGTCAISGGPYADHEEVRNGVASLLPVDLHIPGCPPHPLTVLDGLLRLLGRPPES